MSKGQKRKIKEIDSQLKSLADLQQQVFETMGETASKSDVFKNLDIHYGEQRRAIANKIGRKK